MAYGLSDDTVNKIHVCLELFPAVEKAVLYGSRAKGNFKNGSDIDLALFGSLLNRKILFKLENVLDELLLPYTFDITVFDQLKNKDLREHIQRIGQIFYQRKEVQHE